MLTMVDLSKTSFPYQADQTIVAKLLSYTFCHYGFPF